MLPVCCGSILSVGEIGDEVSDIADRHRSRRTLRDAVHSVPIAGPEAWAYSACVDTCRISIDCDGSLTAGGH